MRDGTRSWIGIAALGALLLLALGASGPSGGCSGEPTGTAKAPLTEPPFEETAPGVWSFDGDLLPASSGGVNALGSETHEWNVWALDVFAHGSVVSSDSIVPLLDTEWPTSAHELGARNVPVAWGRVAGSALTTPHYNVASVAHVGLGRYKVTLDVGVQSLLVPIVTIFGTGQRRDANASQTSGSGFYIYVVNDQGAYTDCDLGFVVFGF